MMNNTVKTVQNNPIVRCAYCGEQWPCIGTTRRDVSPVEVIKHRPMPTEPAPLCLDVFEAGITCQKSAGHDGAHQSNRRMWS